MDTLTSVRSWLYGLSAKGMKLGLDRMKELLRRIGNPQSTFCAIHIGGTNGKGSTAAFCGSLLLAAYRAALGSGELPPRVGLYTSPHLLRLTERVQISNTTGSELVESSELELMQTISLIRKQCIDLDLTFFEVITAAAFFLFAERGVKIAVIEVGLGGRLDATRLCNPVSSVITSISYDHTELLGVNLVDIAYEKAGIFRPGVPCYAACDDTAARAVLQRQASALSCPISFYAKDQSEIPHIDESIRDQLPLLGKHQKRNAALALASVQHAPMPFRTFLLDPAVQREGLLLARWPGRLERVCVLSNQAEFWIDAAHNPEGASMLSEWMAENWAERDVTVVFGVVKGKQFDQMLGPLECAKRIILTRPVSDRAEDPRNLLLTIKKRYPEITIDVIDNCDDAFAFAARSAKPTGLVMVYGSVFLIGQVRRVFLDEQYDPMIVQDPGELAHAQMVGS